MYVVQCHIKLEIIHYRYVGSLFFSCRVACVITCFPNEILSFCIRISVVHAQCLMIDFSVVLPQACDIYCDSKKVEIYL